MSIHHKTSQNKITTALARQHSPRPCFARCPLNLFCYGDGEAKLFQQADKGSILSKVAAGSPPKLIELLPDYHKEGNWNQWPDNTKLFKFDVILTNPPFGEDRAYRPRTPFDRNVIEMYEIWKLSGGGDNIDLGVVFLENPRTDER